MRPSGTSPLQTIYPTCHAFLDSDTWNACIAEYTAEQNARSLEEFFRQRIRGSGLPEFLPGLARLEHAIAETQRQRQALPADVGRCQINPTISLIESSWKGLPTFIDSRDNPTRDAPQRGEERILVWFHPKTEAVRYRPATDEDLLVLKVIAEDINPRVVAKDGQVPPVAIKDAIDRAVADGLILKPRSLIRRERGDTEAWRSIDEHFVESPFFTIQWHITQACDLHCRHCYDRSRRSPLMLDAGIDILDDLAIFCTNRHVRGQVSFSGGNPLLHPHFFDLYRAASERGFVTAILGNPTSRENLERIVEIQTPSQYQVSLEGLEEYNDYIRGDGNSRDVMAFLPILRSLGITAQVMLTLTRDNINQVLPLAEILRDEADSFTFNRLSQVGEGAQLAIPGRDEYRAFLIDYVEAAKTNPVMSLKDNLTNIVFYQRGDELFGGCAGYGCSAAFNFIALLPDGEAHACRKFPSYIGNVYHQGIGEIYDSEAAHRYRIGTEACRSCPIRPVCGGCLAVMYGQGLDIFKARDPHCFM